MRWAKKAENATDYSLQNTVRVVLFLPTNRSWTGVTQTPLFGSPKMTEWLRRRWGYKVAHKRIERLMRLMGLQAMAPGPNTSKSHPEHSI